MKHAIGPRLDDDDTITTPLRTGPERVRHGSPGPRHVQTRGVEDEAEDRKDLLPLPWSAGSPAGSWSEVVGEGRAHSAVRLSLAAGARAPAPTGSAALGTSTRALGNLNKETQMRGRAGASGLAAAVHRGGARRAPTTAGARH